VLNTNVLAYAEGMNGFERRDVALDPFADCRKRERSSRYRFLGSFLMCLFAKAGSLEATPVTLC